MNLGQSKRASVVEAVVNTVIGVVLALVAQTIIFHMLGLSVSLHQNFTVVMWMSAVSVARQYVLRRVWNSEFWLRWSWRRPFHFTSRAALIIGYRKDTNAPIYQGKQYISPEASAAIAAKIKAQRERAFNAIQDATQWDSDVLDPPAAIHCSECGARHLPPRCPPYEPGGLGG